MLIATKVLSDHLNRIRCGGLVRDAVLERAFQCQAQTVDGCLFFTTSGVEKIDPLSELVGVVDLERITKFLGHVEEEKISLDITEYHVKVAAKGWAAKFVTSAPDVVGSKISPDISDRVFALLDGTWIPLRRQLVAMIINNIQDLSAEVVMFRLSPQGSTVVVGEELVDSLTIEMPELQAPEGELKFRADLVGPILKQLSDFTKAEIQASSPNAVLGLREGSYLYVVSAESDEASAAGDRGQSESAAANDGSSNQ